MTSEIKLRTIDFQFSDDIQWNWNPGNPAFANCAHYMCFMAPGFERYFIKAIRAALPMIEDPGIRDEAELFCKQEGAHAKHHTAHVKMLARKFPGIDSIMTEIGQSYDELFRSQPNRFHLAYAALVEATFSPVTKFLVDNRQYLFKDPDPRMASFIMWHMMEEYEHRSAAHDIYNAAVGSYFYRLRVTFKVFAHLAKAAMIVERGFRRYIKADASQPQGADPKGFLSGVPLRNKIRGVLDLLATLLPWYHPDRIPQPEWVRRWFEADRAGVDMRTYFPTLAD